MSANDSQALGPIRALGLRWWSAFAWCLLILPVIAGAFFRELREVDESRYALVAKQLVETGNYLVMHLNGEVYPDKPPMVFWLAGLSGSLADWSVFGVRLPSVLSMFGCASVLHLFALRWWSSREAMWAPCLFLATGMVFDKGGQMVIDPLLTFLCLASLYLAHSSFDSGVLSLRRLISAGILLGLAMLTKGPVAIVNTGLVLVLWILLQRWRMNIPTLSWRGLIGLLLISLVLPLVWAGAASWQDPELAKHLFYGQHLGRVVSGTVHAGPIWKYMLSFPAYLLPTTIMVAAGLRAAGMAFKKMVKGSQEPTDAGFIYAATWLLSLFLFFTLITVKRDVYLMSAYPAAALLAARWIAMLTSKVSLPLLVSHSMPAAFMILGLLVGPVLGIVEGSYAVAWRAALAGVPFLVFGILAARSARRRAWQAWAGHQLAGFAFGMILVSAILVPRWNQTRSGHALAKRVAVLAGEQSLIPCLGVRSFLFSFYCDLPTVEGCLEEALAQEGDSFLALVDRHAYQRMDDRERDRFRVLESWGMERKEVLILVRAETETPPRSER